MSTERWKILRAAGLGALFLLLLAPGCLSLPPAQPDPTRFYLLSVLSASETAAAIAPEAAPLRVGLRPVVLPAFLDSRAMVVRTGANEVRYEDYARWAEPLDQGVARVVRAALADSPRVGAVLAYPFSFEADRDYDVTIRLLNCEGVREASGRGGVKVQAVIEIYSTGAGAGLVARRVFTAGPETWNGRDYAQLAQALSRAVAELGQAVAAALPEGK